MDNETMLDGLSSDQQPQCVQRINFFDNLKIIKDILNSLVGFFRLTVEEEKVAGIDLDYQRLK